MNGTSDGVSKLDIFLALTALSDKLNVFEANIINVVDEKVHENEKAVQEQVNENIQTVVNKVSCVELFEIPKDLPCNVNADLLEKHYIPNGLAIPRFSLRVKWKNVLMNRLVHSDADIEWLLLQCMGGIKYTIVNKVTKHRRMVTVASKFRFINDKYKYFKPFKELPEQCDSLIKYPAEERC